MAFLIILTCVICAVAGYHFGNQRTIGGGAGLLLGLFLGIIGLVIVLVSPRSDTEYDMEIQRSYDNIEEEKKTAADQLMKWHELKEKGAITNEEFEEKKKQLLY